MVYQSLGINNTTQQFKVLTSPKTWFQINLCYDNGSVCTKQVQIENYVVVLFFYYISYTTIFTISFIDTYNKLWLQQINFSATWLPLLLCLEVIVFSHFSMYKLKINGILTWVNITRKRETSRLFTWCIPLCLITLLINVTSLIIIVIVEVNKHS